MTTLIDEEIDAIDIVIGKLDRAKRVLGALNRGTTVESASLMINKAEEIVEEIDWGHTRIRLSLCDEGE